MTATATTTEVKPGVKLNVTMEYWPTLTEAILEVRGIISKDPNAKIRGEDGDVDAKLVLDLLIEFAKKDPSRRLRPLGWNKPPAAVPLRKTDTPRFGLVRQTRGCGTCRKPTNKHKGCC